MVMMRHSWLRSPIGECAFGLFIKFSSLSMWLIRIVSSSAPAYGFYGYGAACAAYGGGVMGGGAACATVRLLCSLKMFFF